MYFLKIFSQILYFLSIFMLGVSKNFKKLLKILKEFNENKKTWKIKKFNFLKCES